MDPSIEAVLDLVRRQAHWFVFGWLALENALFLGVLVPGITVLIVAGLLIATGDLSPAAAIAAGVAGTWVGDNVNFAVGRWGLRRFRWVRRVLEENDDVHQFLDRYPRAVYVFFEFPVYLRTAFPLTLGSMGVPLRTWLWIDAIAAPLFVGAYVGLGFGLARFVLEVADLETAARQIVQWGNGIAILFGLLFAYGTVRFVHLLWRTARDPADPPGA
jgi:membrane-associated protein